MNSSWYHLHARWLFVAAVALAGACRAATAPNLGELDGRVAYKYSVGPGATYTGEIGIAGTSVGTIRVYIFDALPMTVRLHSGTLEHIAFDSIVVGDSVTAWYDRDAVILTSLPPVYPVRRLEFVR